MKDRMDDIQQVSEIINSISYLNNVTQQQLGINEQVERILVSLSKRVDILENNNNDK
jgi:hypothetical protein